MKYTKKEENIFAMYPHQMYVSINKSISLRKLDKLLRKQFEIPEGYKLEFTGNGTYDTTVRLEWCKYRKGAKRERL